MSISRLLSIRLAAAVAIICSGVMMGVVIAQQIPIGSLEGKVTAQESGNPIPAWIYLTGRTGPENKRPSFGVQADKSGRFSISRIPAGEYRLEITGRAHRMKPVPVTIEEGKVLRMDAELQPDASSLEIMCTSTYSPPMSARR